MSPEYRPCDEILHRFTDEPAGTGEPVHLGPARSKLRVAVVAGLGAECFGGFVSAFPFALEHLQGFGYQTASIRVDGLSSSTNNGRQVKDAVVAMDLAPDERLVPATEGDVRHPRGPRDLPRTGAARRRRGQRLGLGQWLAAGRRCARIDAHPARVSARIGVARATVARSTA